MTLFTKEEIMSVIVNNILQFAFYKIFIIFAKRWGGEGATVAMLLCSELIVLTFQIILCHR